MDIGNFRGWKENDEAPLEHGKGQEEEPKGAEITVQRHLPISNKVRLSPWEPRALTVPPGVLSVGVHGAPVLILSPSLCPLPLALFLCLPQVKWTHSRGFG